MSWTGLPKFADDTITDYSRLSPSIESNLNDLQSSNSSVYENGESSSSILSKPVITFVKATDSPTVIKTNKDETVRKSSEKYAEMYRKTSKSFNVRVKQGKTWVKNNYTHKSRSPRTVFHKTDRTPATGNSQNIIDDKGYWDSGCSRHMTGNISYLSDYEPYDGGYVSFGQGGGEIIGKAKDDNNVLLRTPRQHNMYSVDLNNIVPHKDLPCLVAKASGNESMLWHRRLVMTDDFSRFTWTFFLKTKDETSGILSNFITEIENLKELKADQMETLTVESAIPTKEAGPNWLFDIDTLTNSMNYVPVVVAGTSSTNFSAHLETSSSNAQDACNADIPESSGNSNPTATSTNLQADQMEILTVESAIPTVSLPVPTACLETSPKTTSGSRLISKRVISQDETPYLDNILTLSNRFEDILRVTTNTCDTNGVEVDLGNMEYNISASPTPTFRIYKDRLKSQIIGHVDTPEEPKKVSDALKDPSWVEAMQEELLQFKIQNVWILVDCPEWERPIGIKWVLYSFVFYLKKNLRRSLMLLKTPAG
nr:hypothetical protein [Tanacetum cinerariifolium]